jgi:hypothetical protein
MLLMQDCPFVERGKQRTHDTDTTLMTAMEHHLHEAYADSLLNKEGSVRAFFMRRTQYASTEYRPPSWHSAAPW